MNYSKFDKVELRCPRTKSRLFAIVRKNTELASVVPEFVMEFSCRDCRDAIGKETGTKPYRVLHLFDSLGDFHSTEVYDLDISPPRALVQI